MPDDKRYTLDKFITAEHIGEAVSVADVIGSFTYAAWEEFLRTPGVLGPRRIIRMTLESYPGPNPESTAEVE